MFRWHWEGQSERGQHQDLLGPWPGLLRMLVPAIPTWHLFHCRVIITMLVATAVCCYLL